MKHQRFIGATFGYEIAPSMPHELRRWIRRGERSHRSWFAPCINDPEMGFKSDPGSADAAISRERQMECRVLDTAGEAGLRDGALAGQYGLRHRGAFVWVAAMKAFYHKMPRACNHVLAAQNTNHRPICLQFY